MDEALRESLYSTRKLREFFEQGKALPVTGGQGIPGVTWVV